jgi:hypothetical protein
MTGLCHANRPVANRIRFSYRFELRTAGCTARHYPFCYIRLQPMAGLYLSFAMLAASCSSTSTTAIRTGRSLRVSSFVGRGDLPGNCGMATRGAHQCPVLAPSRLSGGQPAVDHPVGHRRQSASIMSSLGLDLADALFEAVSAVTTTGATVISQARFKTLPGSCSVRSLLQWMGGIGIVALGLLVLAVSQGWRLHSLQDGILRYVGETLRPFQHVYPGLLRHLYRIDRKLRTPLRRVWHERTRRHQSCYDNDRDRRLLHP